MFSRDVDLIKCPILQAKLEHTLKLNLELLFGDLEVKLTWKLFYDGPSLSWCLTIFVTIC